jgi:hypothetical protein
MAGQTIPVTVRVTPQTQPGAVMLVVVATDAAGTKNQWFFGVDVQ